MKRKILYILFIVITTVIISDSCTKEVFDLSEEINESGSDYSIVLRWYNDPIIDSKEKAIRGFLWAMSFLGAEIEEGSLEKSINWIDENTFELKYEELGFSDQAILALQKIILRIKNSEEYIENELLDLGRFIVLTLNSSNHYYSITGMPNHLSEIIMKYNLQGKEFALIESAISKGDRIIQISELVDNYNSFFMATEGHGKLLDSSFSDAEFEVVDIMPNGQSRFGIYDVDSNLILAADTNFSLSGKPSKCLWCHEINIQSAFFGKTDIPGYLTQAEFDSLVNYRRTKLDEHRISLHSSIDFELKNEHELMEVIYISFMEPSVNRISQEWNIDISEVKAQLAHLSTHIHAEFPELGELYTRQDVDNASSLKRIKVPSDPREKSDYEPNFLIE